MRYWFNIPLMFHSWSFIGFDLINNFTEDPITTVEVFVDDVFFSVVHDTQTTWNDLNKD